nr:MAG TPA: hypothetical protein [Caudoviricetes sp.]
MHRFFFQFSTHSPIIYQICYVRIIRNKTNTITINSVEELLSFI